MANYSLKFSFVIPLDTDEQKAWARKAVAFLQEVEEDEREHDFSDHELAAILPDQYDQYDAADIHIGYRYAIDQDDLWIYVAAEESGDPDHVVPLVQEFLRRFRPDDAIGLSWALTCSKPEIDQFGGGAVFITADRDEWTSTDEWIVERYKAHRSSLT